MRNRTKPAYTTPTLSSYQSVDIKFYLDLQEAGFFGLGYRSLRRVAGLPAVQKETEATRVHAGY
jgi:hypothetical protein